MPWLVLRLTLRTQEQVLASQALIARCKRVPSLLVEAILAVGDSIGSLLSNASKSSCHLRSHLVLQLLTRDELFHVLNEGLVHHHDLSTLRALDSVGFLEPLDQTLLYSSDFDEILKASATVLVVESTIQGF